MTRRKIMSMTSTKKRDTMAPANWDGTSWVPAAQNVIGQGGTINMFLFPATARNTVTTEATPSEARRSKKYTFARGFKEVVHMESSTNSPWEWRQIVFSMKGLGHHVAVNDYVAYGGPGVGYMRGQRLVLDGKMKQDVSTILFQGVKGLDWLTEMVAPINTSAVTLHRDRTRRIFSNNDVGSIRTYKDWTPLNKSLVYADNESGDQSDSSRWSVDTKPGMGDVFVVDLIRGAIGSLASDVLLWRSNVTYYWHEK